MKNEIFTDLQAVEMPNQNSERIVPRKESDELNPHNEERISHNPSVETSSNHLSSNEMNPNELNAYNGRRVSRKENSNLHMYSTERRKFAFIGLSSGAGTTTIALSFAKYISELRKPKKRSIFRRRKDERDAATGFARETATGAPSGLARKTATGTPSGLARETATGTPSGLGRDFSSTHAVVTERETTLVPTAFIDISDENRSLSGMTYDRIGIDKRFIGRDFLSYYYLLSTGQSVRGKCNPDMGINWALRIPGEEYERNEITSIVRLIENVQGANVVLDISGRYGDTLKEEQRIEELKILLTDADMIFVIIDPLPSSLMADRMKFAMLKSLEAMGHSVIWVINKSNRGVNIKEMKNYLHLRNFVEIPFFDEREIYAAEYNCETMLSAPNSSQLLQNCFKAIAELHNFYMDL